MLSDCVPPLLSVFSMLSITHLKLFHSLPKDPNFSNKLENVDHPVYLASLLTTKDSIDNEIYHHLTCASRSLTRLRKRVWERQPKKKDHDLSPKSCLQFCMDQKSKLHLVGKSYSISWEKRCTNTTVMEEADTPCITGSTTQWQFRWTVCWTPASWNKSCTHSFY